MITVSHSFIATANCIRYCGATPVFVDIDPDDLQYRSAARGRGDHTAYARDHRRPPDGHALRSRGIAALAARHGIALVEDAACAAGSQIRVGGEWEAIGKPHGQIACFSFHPRKVITTGEGGMLTTADADLDRKFRLLRQHGMSVPDTVRHGSPQVIFEDYLWSASTIG